MNENQLSNLGDYYRLDKETYELRTNYPKLILGILVIIACIVLVIYPGIIMHGWLVRIAAIILGLIAILYTLASGSDFYNKKTGGKIVNIGTTKFANPPRGTEPYGPRDMRIIEMYENEEWDKIINEPKANDRPMQLLMDYDEKGKVIYLLLCRYFSDSEFRAIAPVKTISEPNFSQLLNKFKQTTKF